MYVRAVVAAAAEREARGGMGGGGAGGMGDGAWGSGRRRRREGFTGAMAGAMQGQGCCGRHDHRGTGSGRWVGGKAGRRGVGPWQHTRSPTLASGGGQGAKQDTGCHGSSSKGNRGCFMGSGGRCCQQLRSRHTSVCARARNASRCTLTRHPYPPNPIGHALLLLACLHTVRFSLGWYLQPHPRHRR